MAKERKTLQEIIDECEYNRKHGITGDRYNGFVIYSDLTL